MLRVKSPIEAAAERLVIEAIGQANFGLLPELCYSDVIVHTPNIPLPLRGLDGVSEFIQTIHASFRNIRFTIKDSFHERHKVVVRWIFRGDFVEEFRNVPATNQEFTLNGIMIFHFKAGKVHEVWAIESGLWTTKAF